MPEELIIFKKTYDFSKWVFQHTNKFPKSHRFSVAVKLENGVLEFLQEIAIANNRSQKMPLLRKADEKLMLLKIYLRFSHDLKFISTSSYEFAIKSLVIVHPCNKKTCDALLNKEKIYFYKAAD